MIPGKYNMICPQGSTFLKQITYSVDSTPVDLTGYIARMQVRETYSSTNVILSLTNQGAEPTISVNDEGQIDLYINADDTAKVVAKEYVYDLELDSGGTVTRLLEGKFIVTPEVTR